MVSGADRLGDTGVCYWRGGRDLGNSGRGRRPLAVSAGVMCKPSLILVLWMWPGVRPGRPPKA
jgi:hypothetical protein